MGAEETLPGGRDVDRHPIIHRREAEMSPPDEPGEPLELTLPEEVEWAVETRTLERWRKHDYQDLADHRDELLWPEWDRR
jgi:hypothetical protein